ncbi:DNA methyltransferase [Nonomuraea sp. NPDC004580]|uniref:DNA methyltransferase n=1 Tax=Nonomuraea sp. NPDC004580 TaxID=3154552 RepID=UPI0033A80330
MSKHPEREVPQLALEGLVSKATHQLFRYPAKFHPPVCKTLINRYTVPGDVILDPFVGSGTALVESALARRYSIGIDVDPLATQISLAKTRAYDISEIRFLAAELHSYLKNVERAPGDYERLMFDDIPETDYRATITAEGLWVPEIPRLDHWFRRYVVIDLSRIKKAIDSLTASDKARLFLDTIFGSIIRNSSNADPVPVSGLEYTSHMKKRDAKGRLVNPFALLRGALKRSISAVEEYSVLQDDDAFEPIVHCANSTGLSGLISGKVDAVITSPPYHNAVDYYRRHQLEMFWLGLTNSQAERLALLPGYIGRPRIAAKDPLLSLPWEPKEFARDLERRMSQVSQQRATDFRHYVTAMTQVFEELARVLPGGTPAVFVVGHSTWNGEEISTRRLLEELASSNFALEEQFSYPVKNRYMSYSRKNAANIDREYVLTFKRL